MKKPEYRKLEKAILADIMDQSLLHGPVEVQITQEGEDGDLIPAIIVRSAPDGVIRHLVLDDRIADLALEYGELAITPAPDGVADLLFHDLPTLYANGEPVAAAERELIPDCIPPAPKVTNLSLDTLSWSDIDAIGRTGDPAQVFGLGAYKSFTLKNGQKLTARIIGFDHDKLADEKGNARMTWELTTTLPEERAMNAEATNKTSWRDSDLRAWLNGALWDLLPDDLQEVIKPVVKQTAAGGQGEEIIEDVDNIFIKSEREMTGRTFYSKPGEGHQYALYAAEGVSWAMKDPDGNVAYPWLRSPSASTASFVYCDSDGTPNSYGIASYDYGVAFGFCV